MNVQKAFPAICQRLKRHPSALLRRQYLLHIEKMKSSDPELKRLQIASLRQEPIKSILENRKAGGWWYFNGAGGVYKKYQGWVWSLLFAAEMGVSETEPRLRASCEYFMDQCFCKGNGAFENSARVSRTIACFVAHACYFLTYFGFGSDDRVQSSYRWLAGNLGTDGGMKCFVMDVCLNETCTMAIPKFLKAASVLTPSVRKKILGSSVDECVKRLIAVDIDRYQPVEAAEWQKSIYGKPMKEIRRAKAAYKASGEYKRKSSWMRFQFPLHYDSDLLESLIYLGRLNVKKNPVLQSAAQRILLAGTADGWKAGRSLNGKLWADIPFEDDWITLRALEVVSRYA